LIPSSVLIMKYLQMPAPQLSTDYGHRISRPPAPRPARPHSALRPRAWQVGKCVDAVLMMRRARH
jgi:hypothetical protein